MENRPQVRPLDHETTLTIEQVRERYSEVETAFKKIEKRYSGIFGGRKRVIAEDDLITITNCLGVLLPLGMNPSVQGEIRQADNIEGTVFTKTGQLQQDIMLFATRFENSGVKLIQGGADF